MKRSFDIKRFKFYLWAGVGYFFLGVLSIVRNYPGRFFSVVFNNVWGVVYVIALNFILFEYSVPFVLRKRRAIIYNILLGILLLWVYMMLYSYGSYVWRQLGTVLHVYTALRIFASLDQALENQMAYSAGSVFFFGIARHIYYYIKLRQSEQQLRIEKQAAELNYLRSQTNRSASKTAVHVSRNFYLSACIALSICQ